MGFEKGLLIFVFRHQHQPMAAVVKMPKRERRSPGPFFFQSEFGS